MAIYYVDATTGSDSDDGLTEGNAWQTIAKVNGESFSAGDSILFKCGEEWREQLTVPSSGAEGNHITFGQYGTGADPIINGSDVVATWATVTDVEALVSVLGGDAAVPAFYDTRYGVTDSGGVVDSWDDARGAAGYGPQLAAAGGVRPVWNSGDSLIEFDDSDDALTAAAFAGFDLNTSKTMFVITEVALGTYDNLVSIYNAAQNHYWGFASRGNTNYWSEAFDGGASNALVDSGVASGATRRLLHAEIDDDYSGCAVRDTAIVEVASTLVASEDFILTVGKGKLATTNPCPASVRAVIVVEGKLSSAQLAAVDKWAYAVHAAAITGGNPAGDYDNLWSAAFATATPKQVQFDGVVGTKKASVAALAAAGDWFWESDVLYTYSATDPDSAYTSVEAGTRNHAIDIYGTAYVTVQDLTAKGANLYGIRIDKADHTMSGVTVQRCLATLNYDVGIFSWAATSLAETISILNNEASYNGKQAGLDGTTAAPVGIEILGSDATYGTLVHYNDIHDNYWGAESDQGSANTQWRYNKIYDNTLGGMHIDNSDGNDFSYNLVYGNGSWGLRLWDEAAGTVSNTTIYNNVFYGNAVGVIVEDEQTNLKIKNNILLENTADSAAEEIAMEDGHTYTGLDVDYNCIFRAGGGTYFDWGGTNYNFADWKTNSSQDANSINANPLMIDPANGSFTLAGNSPCIEAGVDVSLTQDYAGTVVPVGLGFDIGAYEFAPGSTGSMSRFMAAIAAM